MNAKHVLLKGNDRPKQADAHRISNVDPASHVEVTLSLRGPAVPDASALPAKPLSRDLLASSYGAKQADADKVAATLSQYGIKVEEVSLIARSMRVSGTADAMQKAFQANLGIYHNAKQGDFRGREGKLQIPADLDGIVTGVFGLDERRVAHRKTQATAAAAHHKAAKPLAPADFEARYNFPPGTAQSQQIAIAEFDGGYFDADLQAFCAKYNRPVPQVTTVSVGAPAYTLQQIQQLPKQQRQQELESSIEVNMDVQVIAGLCSGAHIFVYFAPFTQKGWVDLINQIIGGTPATPVVLSVSWGLAEDDPDWSSSAVTEINARLQSLAMLGITACISAGDDGSGDQIDDGKCHVDFPSCSPFVLSVGGTMLAGSAASPTEEVWWESPGRRTNTGGGATGGGVSVLFNRPAWQTVKVASLNQGSIDGRIIPDIAALAGPPLYDLIFMGKDFPNGGTSASAPLWAALIARICANGKAARFLPPLLYQNGANGSPVGQSGSVDITTGNNTSSPQPGVGYKAGPGFDAVSGWGVPDGQKLLALL
ncbi:MAG: S53 family peptidase [Terriglobales bacterium]|jgi:kumamolisin